MVNKNLHTQTSYSPLAVLGFVLGSCWGWMASSFIGLRCEGDPVSAGGFTRWFCDPSSPTWIYVAIVAAATGAVLGWFLWIAESDRSVLLALAGFVAAGVVPFIALSIVDGI